MYAFSWDTVLPTLLAKCGSYLNKLVRTREQPLHAVVHFSRLTLTCLGSSKLTPQNEVDTTQYGARRELPPNVRGVG